MYYKLTFTNTLIIIMLLDKILDTLIITAKTVPKCSDFSKLFDINEAKYIFTYDNRYFKYLPFALL